MNTLRLDPTRTTMLRRRFVLEMKRRFDAFRKALNHLVVEEDAFGLARKGILVIHQRYAALTTPQQLEEFRRWVEEQTGRSISGDDNWLRKYIEEAYEKGQGRAFDDAMKKYGYGGRAQPDYYRGSREQFLRDAFRRPASADRVALLASRAYTDLKGVTPQMSTALNRVMTDAIIQGKSPREVGRELNKVVDGYKNRGATIARTETIRAHADGQLESLKSLGVEEVGVMVEWSTAGDDLVCDLCFELDGTVFKIDEASGIIPRHPNCRCAWLPANVGEDAKRQAWYKKDDSGRAVWQDVVQKKGGEAQAAVDRSIAGEIPKGLRGRRSLEEQRGISRWPGADVRVGKPLDAIDVSLTPSKLPATPPKPAPPKPPAPGPSVAEKKLAELQKKATEQAAELKRKQMQLDAVRAETERLKKELIAEKAAVPEDRLVARKVEKVRYMEDQAKLTKADVANVMDEFNTSLNEIVARIPELDGNYKPVYVEARKGKSFTTSSGQNAVADYAKSDGHLRVCSELKRGGNLKPTLGRYDVGADMRSVIRHEYGHHFWDNNMMAKGRLQFRDILKETKLLEQKKRFAVSEYATTNFQEMFAECFSAYTHPNYVPGSLPPKIEAFFKEIAGKMDVLKPSI